MALNTGLLLSTSTVTKLSITDVVVKAEENLAYSQGFKSLKFQNRRGEPIFDVALIARVDYEVNLDPPNAPDEVADDQNADKEDQDDDSTDRGSDDDTGERTETRMRKI